MKRITALSLAITSIASIIMTSSPSYANPANALRRALQAGREIVESPAGEAATEAGKALGKQCLMDYATDTSSLCNREE